MHRKVSMRRVQKKTRTDLREDARDRREKKHHKYSGHNSVGFWKRVSALEPDEKRAIYTAGVMLQNMEEYVLRILETAETAAMCRQVRMTGKMPVRR